MVKKVTNVLAWLVSGGLLLASLAFVALATPLVGNRALIVRSGSMEPAIIVGDMVVVRAGEYRTGDAIAYRVPGRENMIVTHRIVEVKDGQYRTKGDANAEADSWVITGKDIIGKELFVVPWVGTLLAFAKSRIGFVSLVVAPAVIVILSEVRVIWREMRKKPYLTPSLRPARLPDGQGYGGQAGERAWRVLPVRRFVDSASAVAIFLMIAIMTSATFALYTDTGTSSNNIFTAAAVFATPTPTVTPTPTPTATPVPTPGPGDVVLNEVMWMGSIGGAGGDDEWLELRNITSHAIDLTGWEIVKAGTGVGSTVPLSGSVPANGFWLVTRQTIAVSQISDSVVSDQVASGISFVNSGEQLILRDAADVVIDQTPAGAWPAGLDSSTRKSMSRNNPPSDGTVGSNWHTCTNAACNDTTYWDLEGSNYGTPKATNL